MEASLQRAAALVLTSLLLTATASAGDGVGRSEAVYDITHFDVLPLTSPLDAEQVAYAALFAYRDNSASDPGLQSFRIINWLEATRSAPAQRSRRPTLVRPASPFPLPANSTLITNCDRRADAHV